MASLQNVSLSNSQYMRSLFFLCLFWLVSTSVGAQPGPPPPDPGEPVPISGIEVLLGAGALLGGRQILKRKKIDS
jgi:hypothetical protein